MRTAVSPPTPRRAAIGLCAYWRPNNASARPPGANAVTAATQPTYSTRLSSHLRPIGLEAARAGRAVSTIARTSKAETDTHQ